MNTIIRRIHLTIIILLSAFSMLRAQERANPIFISGVYPSLTTYADNGGEVQRLNECGIGAIVPWAGKLWMVNYAAHEPYGSDHKLYSIGDDMKMTIHPESVGGTPAGRMIHKESNQLLIAHYVIDDKGKVRVVSPSVMPGRITAFTRHLKDPVNWVYVVDMEGMIYELNVHTVEVRKLFHKPVPGWHAKGAYVAQGRLIMANNGEHVGGSFRKGITDAEADAILQRIKAKTPEERGVLATWDGDYWTVLERKQYTDVMGPGGLYGNSSDSDVAWSIGWDNRALRLKLLDGGEWSTYLLPKSSFNNDAIHGWYTEWPRIREIGGGKWMMDMHGMFFDFPPTFSRANTAGLAPIGSHLRYIPDFSEWNGRLVLATDETSIQGNPKAGQPQSNLWFGSFDELKRWGPGSGYGGPWIEEPIGADAPSLPFLTNGFKERILHLVVHDQEKANFGIEVDFEGKGQWKLFKTVSVSGYTPFVFPEGFKGQWVRLRPDRNCVATAYFHQTDANYRDSQEGRALFSGLANLGEEAISGSSLYALRRNRNLGILNSEDRTVEFSKEQFQFVSGPALSDEVKGHLDRSPKFWLDGASVVIESRGERLRLPKGDVAYDQPFPFGWPRDYREIESERELANIHGTFYELPLEVNDQPPLFQKMRPVSSHRKQIGDFASWNGLLAMTGVRSDAKADGHVFSNDARSEAVWFGGIDDLWKLGKPVGRGGPWNNASVLKGMASDPYLMTGYDRKTLVLEADAEVEVSLEINFDHNGYYPYRRFQLRSGEPLEFRFPNGFSAHWARLETNRDCRISATFIYE